MNPSTKCRQRQWRRLRARLILTPKRRSLLKAEDKPESEVTFDQLSEEELLAGIEGLVPPEKSDDY